MGPVIVLFLLFLVLIFTIQGGIEALLLFLVVLAGVVSIFIVTMGAGMLLGNTIAGLRDLYNWMRGKDRAPTLQDRQEPHSPANNGR